MSSATFSIVLALLFGSPKSIDSNEVMNIVTNHFPFSYNLQHFLACLIHRRSYRYHNETHRSYRTDEGCCADSSHQTHDRSSSALRFIKLKQIVEWRSWRAVVKCPFSYQEKDRVTDRHNFTDKRPKIRKNVKDGKSTTIQRKPEQLLLTY